MPSTSWPSFPFPKLNFRVLHVPWINATLCQWDCFLSLYRNHSASKSPHSIFWQILRVEISTLSWPKNRLIRCQRRWTPNWRNWELLGCQTWMQHPMADTDKGCFSCWAKAFDMPRNRLEIVQYFASCLLELASLVQSSLNEFWNAKASKMRTFSGVSSLYSN